MLASLGLSHLATNLGFRDELPKFSSGRRVRPPACIARPVSGRRTLSPFGDPPPFQDENSATKLGLAKMMQTPLFLYLLTIYRPERAKMLKAICLWVGADPGGFYERK